ncbi:MAG: glucose 1-dehydrogenase [Rhodospirillaceae bacterium]|jgi:meso-butanediol dehydrogenase / (S,S)-butanediol dehydrogenase / diacetyl reductase|nr:glucose 1-dehydrogenase [Rhodospirillaceae bacterium]MBT6117377.1 glucose 1-dehydrogenase [Rhodospirillaceae bacterium]
MAGLLAGQTALVTGGGNGIGAAIARGFVEAGASVVVADRDAAGAERVAKEIGGRAMALDVSDEAAVAEAFGALKGLDTLVNNAGLVPPQRRVEEIDAAEWDKVFAVNVRGAMLCSRAAVPLMRAGGGGSIVNIASITGWAPDPKLAAYSASKAAVIAMTDAMAQDLGPYRIRVNAISPGTVASEALMGRIEGRAKARGEPVEDSLARDFYSKIALDRLILPEEVAKAAIFLASDLSSAVTGGITRLDGGYMFFPRRDETQPIVPTM